MDVSERQTLEALIEKELKIKHAAVRERQHKAGEATPSAPDADLTEGSPIGLRLFVMVCIP